MELSKNKKKIIVVSMLVFLLLGIAAILHFSRQSKAQEQPFIYKYF